MHVCIKNSHTLSYIPAMYCKCKHGIPYSSSVQLRVTRFTSADLSTVAQSSPVCAEYSLSLTAVQTHCVRVTVLQSKIHSPCLYDVYSITICVCAPALWFKQWTLSNTKKRNYILSSLIISQWPPLFRLSCFSYVVAHSFSFSYDYILSLPSSYSLHRSLSWK